jgi:thioesterase domain-containing protein
MVQAASLSAAELERYLHAHIPLSKAMAVAVLSVGQDEVVLQAPLAPNINHRDTVFGGSAAALAMLAAWSLLHARLHAERIDARLVIQRNTMEYERPMDADFTARATLAQPQKWHAFTAMLARRGKARITVAAVLAQDGHGAGRLSGEFVALRAGG